MELNDLNEILDCLGGERTVLQYYPDHYAVYLLQSLMDGNDRLSVSDIKQTGLSKLLNKPNIKSLVSGDGYLYQETLNYQWSANSESYVVTLDKWSDRTDWVYDQVTRPGSNLVLQINLNQKWSKLLETLMGGPLNNLFGYDHPLSKTRTTTLGWIRMDMDLNTGEVLIEEIQTDLVRFIGNLRKRALNKNIGTEESFNHWGQNLDRKNCLDTLNQFESLFATHWSEAMLWTAIWFIKEELGMDEIYYHTYETGAKLKNITWSKPPKSLYTKLPKKFCFEETSEGPKFIQNERKIRKKLNKIKQPAWFKLAA